MYWRLHKWSDAPDLFDGSRLLLRPGPMDGSHSACTFFKDGTARAEVGRFHTPMRAREAAMLTLLWVTHG